MIKELLENWPLVILFQGLGVALALGADVVTRKWRPRRDAIFILNGISLLLLSPSFYYLFFEILWPVSAALAFSAMLFPLFWWIFVAWVQKRQLKISWNSAFFEALLQLSVFTWAITGASMLAISFWLFLDVRLAWIYMLSALLAHGILALFRPTIDGAWNS